MKLITDRIEYENSLSIDEYFNLRNNKINWRALSANEKIFKLLKNRVDYENNTEEYMKKYGENRIDWATLSLNRVASELLKDRIVYENGLSEKEYEKLDDNKIEWTYLSGNPYAIELLNENLDKIDWNTLSQNKCAITMLKANFEKIVWESISYNQNAIEILKENVEKIVWDNDYYCLFEEIFINNLSELTDLFKKKIEYEKNITDEKYKKIDWRRLSLTQNTYELLKTYPDKIIWKNLSKNKDPAMNKLLNDRFEYEKRWNVRSYSAVDALSKLIQRKDALYQVSYETGVDFAQNIVPLKYWEWRSYFKGKGEMKIGGLHAQVRNWGNAIVSWTSVYNSSTNSKTRGKAAYNIALGYEAMEDLENAQKWIQLSYIEYPKKAVLSYDFIIENRIFEREKLENQKNINKD